MGARWYGCGSVAIVCAVTAPRLIVAIIATLLAWLLAAFALQGYEIDVRVLRPWQRSAYGWAAFVAGILIGVRLAGLL